MADLTLRTLMVYELLRVARPATRHHVPLHVLSTVMPWEYSMWLAAIAPGVAGNSATLPARHTANHLFVVISESAVRFGVWTAERTPRIHYSTLDVINGVEVLR